MIGAMPAVAVRHERRRQEKRLKRPSQLYLGGQWLPPLQGSPPTPSPHGHNNLEPLPELYLCGKISGLHAVVVCLLLGAVVLVVGLVQLAPGATTTNHRLALLVAGAALLILGFILAGVRCYVLHCVPLPVESPVATPIPPATSEQAPAVPKDTLDLLVGLTLGVPMIQFQSLKSIVRRAKLYKGDFPPILLLRKRNHARSYLSLTRRWSPTQISERLREGERKSPLSCDTGGFLAVRPVPRASLGCSIIEVQRPSPPRTYLGHRHHRPFATVIAFTIAHSTVKHAEETTTRYNFIRKIVESCARKV
ncbi:hypothetical protein EAG_04235 [Camponotus floridanus]|uniref:Uncharacterized protein n=1 Tax=Camponotus floridanus TaxID=104421 RepID=E2AWY1_CAMFO|nr:hypothetical protein EAG_04235 [Camponotus floridanus]